MFQEQVRLFSSFWWTLKSRYYEVLKKQISMQSVVFLKIDVWNLTRKCPCKIATSLNYRYCFLRHSNGIFIDFLEFNTFIFRQWCKGSRTCCVIRTWSKEWIIFSLTYFIEIMCWKKLSDEDYIQKLVNKLKIFSIFFSKVNVWVLELLVFWYDVVLFTTKRNFNLYFFSLFPWSCHGIQESFWKFPETTNFSSTNLLSSCIFL